jgi:hypothetical protein
MNSSYWRRRECVISTHTEDVQSKECCDTRMWKYRREYWTLKQKQLSNMTMPVKCMKTDFK